ncbi:MAG: Beta-glucanase [Polaribacter sejongensis]|nr:MAG: Beta-glucanase [Polaribacter sejongensis]
MKNNFLKVKRMHLFTKVNAIIVPFNKWYRVWLMVFALIGILSCDRSTDDESIVAAPSNLSVSSVVVGTDDSNPNGDGSGKVDFTISATDATSYEVEINNETIELTQTTFSYIFTNGGINDYSIKVTAFNSTGSTSITYSITVFVSSGGLQLVWSDEFDGNGAVDSAKWNYNTGGGGWGNNEEQTYTSDQSNVVIENGILKINAKKESAIATTYYFDELSLLDSGDNVVSVIENFEGVTPSLNEFDGATIQVIDNPNTSGENTTSKVVEFEKNVGASGNSGVWWDRSSAIDLSVNNKLSLKTWSPESGIVVRLKLENSANGSEFHLVDASTSVSNGWETLTYDFSGAPAYNYDRLVVFFDHGNTVANYTSARIKTEGLYDFTYGTVEVRAKLPASQGTWPAIWLLGSNFGSVGWPTCGEIDIMEQVGWNKNKVLGTCHWSNNGSYAGFGLEASVSNSTSSFHIYKLEWTEGSIKISVDDTEYFEMTTNNSMPFNKDFFFILNVALGGNLGGTIDPNFTQDTMEVDYVRVYQ